MSSCVGKILSFLFNETVMRHVAYVFQYKDRVHRLEQKNKRLGEKKERIQGLVDRATRNGRYIETEVSSWLGEVKQMERDIANFLRQQENGEQIMERDFANFLHQQENGEQMERDFANFLRQQENRESFECFPGCMCPNLLWRHKRGKDADDKMSEVIELIRRGELLQTSSVARSASFQSELLFDSPHYYTPFQSRASVFADIMNALNDSGVDMIGVHGPGGAGKTTMVKEVAKEAKRRGIFDKILITVVSKDPNTSKLQKDLVIQLDLECEQTESGRMAVLGKALLNGTRKMLVILDDLWNTLDLKAIGIPISGLGAKGCKIMLTSREREVLKRMNVGRSVFFIDYLKEQEAWELFRKVTGDFRDFGVDECTARKVCDMCADLPIAIVAVGATLMGEEEGVWQNALSRLAKSRLKYIEGVKLVGYTPLKLSYDLLKDEGAKSCFLLCCLFPEDAEISIDDLVRYSFALRFLGREGDTLKDARDKVQAMVYMLKRSCLLLNGRNENCIKMHDVMRDLAISITEEKQTEHGHDWPGGQQFMVNHDIRVLPNNDAWKHHTAISLRINDNFTFPCGVLDCPLLQTFVLEKPGFSYSHIIPNNFFQGTKEATVLDLENISLEFPSLVMNLNHPRMLRLSHCKLLGDLTTIQNLKNHIEILSFENSEIEELPQEIGELTHLRVLDLRTRSGPKVIPKGVISKLTSLEELYVLSDFSGWDTTIDGGRMSNASIVELKLLTLLTVLHVKISAESFKIMVQKCPNLFDKLINFAIFINHPLDMVPFDPLQFLNVMRIYDNEVISPFQTLNVLRIHDIHRIDDELYRLMDKVSVLELTLIPKLEGVFLLGKPQLKFEGSGGGPFSKLTSLKIYGCHGMKYLFSSSIARALQQLKTLRVWCCSKMKQIIGVVDHHNEVKDAVDEVIIFSRLVDMRLWELPEFKSFYPKMEKTTIKKNLSNFTTSAESIFNEKVYFPILTCLEINKLPVEYIWNKQAIQSPRLQNLEMLKVHNCPSLILLVEDFNPNLENPTIESKFNDVFPKLKEISIKGCGSLRHAFSACVARHLMHIQHLYIEDCPGMEMIVSKAKEGGEIDDGAIKFIELEVLQLKDLSNLKSFSESKFEARHAFNFQVAIPKMKALRLERLNCTRQIQLWDLVTTQEYPQEHSIDVELIECQVSTKVLSHHLNQSFRMICNLFLTNCQGFKHVIDLDGTISVGEEKFVDARALYLSDLPELVSLWNKNLLEIKGFQSLEIITISKCPQMKSLLTHSMVMSLQRLEMLCVGSCEMMEEIIIFEDNNINIAGEEKAAWHIEFPKLEYLSLSDLPKLKYFCHDERASFSFSSLCDLEVSGCPKMKTFVFGQICLPPKMIRALVQCEEVEITDPFQKDQYEEVECTNLNAFLKDRNHMAKIIHWGDSRSRYFMEIF